jgi:diguanylate cyclase (GGDEF)-like protein/PAS domain S-box-containing protein
MALRKPVLGGYAVWIALLIAVYYAAPGARPVTWGLISLSGVAAIIVGVRLNKPARKAPFLLLAAGLSCFAAGQLTFLVAARLRVTLPFPSFADVLYLSSYPLYAAGLLLFIRRRAPHGDLRSLIDALTLTVGLALLSWTFLIRPDVANTGLSGLQKAVAIAYPLGDVLLLALLARLLAPGAGRIRSVQLLTVGAVACLVSDSAFTAIQLTGPFHNGTIVDLGWALFYSAWGAAALTPDMTKLTEASATQQATVSPARLALLMLASLIAPIVMLTDLPGGPDVNVSVIAVFSAVLYLLVLTRLWDAAASHRRALDRERALRQAGLSLVTAADRAQLARCVQQTAAALLGGHARGDALLGVRDGATALRAVDTTSPQSAAEPSQLTETWRPLLNGTSPVLVPMEKLPDRARTARAGARWMLLCPLTVSDGHSDGPDLGVIAVFAADRRVLADLTATVQIFAQQVALTLRAMTLRQEVIQQGNEAYFRALVQDASEAIVIVGDDATVKYATPSTAAIFGRTPATGSRFWDLVAPSDRDSVAYEFGKLLPRSGLAPQTVDQEITRLDGRRVHIQGRCSDLRGDPSVAGFVFTLRDVTEQHELEEQLKHRAFHDALTGLPNRILFQDRIAQQVASSARTGLVAAVLFIDVDDFKLVNDTMGHSVGDELLVAVADRLAALTRNSDTAARLGGDEFALLIGNAADAEAADAAAERVVNAFAEPFALDGALVSSTVTVGVATTMDSDNTDDLLRHADLALYAAKAAGKRTWRRYQPVLGAGMVRRREIQEALEVAAATSAFTVSYQPIVSLDSGELAGLEALIRWPHPQWGMMLPGQFISLAEDTGLIIDIGAWVLERATADLARWRNEAARADGAAAANGHGPGQDLYVSVNVSARQFADPGFADTVRRVLAVSGLDPEALTLELTETALLPRDDRLLADLGALKAIGVRLALDDFGTGYSSLSYLGELPIDVVKMDKSFVEGIADSPQRLALASGIVQIAQTLDLQVVAEGIETETQRDLLAAMGCHFGQGYLLAMPMPADQAAELAHTGFAGSGAGN